VRVAQSMGTDAVDKLSPMFVGTIHSYCFQLLAGHVSEFGDYDVLDEHKMIGLLSREYNRYGLEAIADRRWEGIRIFNQHIDAIENELLPEDRLKETEIGKIYEAHTARLKQYHYLTYGQQISLAVRALEDPPVFEAVHEPLRYLFVDEYQDINPAQERLINLLGAEPVKVCVVGDDDQSIYQWRGSNVENILTFTRKYENAKSLPLVTNMRSRPQIVNAANEFVQSIGERLPKKMEFIRPGSDFELVSWMAETPQQEAEIIGDTILMLVKSGYRFQDIGLLFRSLKTSAGPFIETFTAYGIPFRIGGRRGLFLQSEAKVIGKILAWLNDKEWKQGQYSDFQNVTLDEILAELNQVFTIGRTNGDRARAILEKWKMAATSDNEPANLLRDFYRLLRALGVHEWDLENPVLAAKMGTLARVSAFLADFENVTRRSRLFDQEGLPEFQAGSNRGPWYYSRLYSFFQYYAVDEYEDFEGDDEFELNVVDITTVHKAKGLEWPVVFLPSLSARRFPSSMAGRPQKWLLPEELFPAEARKRYEGGDTDERRLFYVAMTRARDMLYMSSYSRITNQAKPSPYLLEVAGKVPQRVDRLPIAKPEGSSEHAPQEKPVIAFSDLALYGICPLHYRLSQQMGFMPQLVVELGYGKAVHQVLRALAEHTRETGELPGSTEVKRILEEAFYLPFAHREAYRKLRDKAEDLVDEYLKEFASDLRRIWETERPFELHLPGAIVTGRADVLLDEENGQTGSLALVDYKTATDPRTEDIYAFQLSIYAAAGRNEGLSIDAAYLHDLTHGKRTQIDISPHVVDRAKFKANSIVNNLMDGNFEPLPEIEKCRRCDVRLICKHSIKKSNQKKK